MMCVKTGSLILIVMLLVAGMTACATLNGETLEEEPGRLETTLTLTTTREVTPVDTQTPLTSIQTSTPILTATPVVEIAPTPLLEPLVTAEMIRLESWSPDGEIFAYWSFAASQNWDFSYPPGELVFVEVSTGRQCAFPGQAQYHYNWQHRSLLEWQVDGRVHVLSADPPVSWTPCQEESVEPLGPSALEVVPDPGLSPAGRFSARTTGTGERENEVETRITNTQTGAIEIAVRWQTAFYGEAGLGGDWLSETLFLIYQSLERGPLLIDLDAGVVPVAEVLFGYPPVPCEDPPCETSWIAYGQPVQDGDGYHLVLAETGVESGQARMVLYHSEDGQVEELPGGHQRMGGISPDGRYLELYRESWSVEMNRMAYEIWLRPLDPPGAPLQFLAAAKVGPLIITQAWSPQGSRMALRSARWVGVYTLPEMKLSGLWETGQYEPVEVRWSPDGRYLAVRGSRGFGQSREGLFLADASQVRKVDHSLYAEFSPPALPSQEDPDPGR